MTIAADHTQRHTHTRYDPWTRDRPVAETSIHQHTTLTTDIHAPGRIRTRNTSKTHALDRAASGIGVHGIVWIKGSRAKYSLNVSRITNEIKMLFGEGNNS